ncbi:short-chain dehydrogenase/reductase SDR [Beutenbergia cavernae DSM 12333]|uniref:Short-chain dehydrogenase/reductase SDR n=1 Tax=Beutenbergia cavernae (strain ATCC BAA-8 / DSM 12333 / CCUG 43141 / JCM 11478 / NBRC 16432 / NCIMB 13614 / HKI 0122) TaxID=471853 RepID=C5C540_BEUC1|nr:SDR family oxidoreductase [Beutenbergia cavernae]ACQ82180.1 short-chain dehydrogenase/reductase SDR [Beutenbergia cavernae DSM 12333]
MNLLAGRRAVVVGTRSRIGATIVAALVEHGARVVGVDREAPRDDAEAPPFERHVVADMSTASGADAAFTAAVDHLGGLDLVVSGAAVQRGGRLWETGEDTWRAVLGGTLDTAFHTMRAGLLHLRRGGALVAVSSVNADVVHPANAAYAASKGAVNTLVRQAALDCAPRGIRVNAVAPALVDGDPERSSYGYPMGRTVTSREVADAVVLLASPLASGITGVVLPVDAGLSGTSAVAMSRPEMLEKLRVGALIEDAQPGSPGGFRPGVMDDAALQIRRRGLDHP